MVGNSPEKANGQRKAWLTQNGKGTKSIGEGALVDIQQHG